MHTSHQNSRFTSVLLATVVALCITSVAATADDATKPAVDKKASSGTELKGVFESINTRPVKADFKTWTTPVIEEAVKPGTRVAQGQTLVRFKTDKIDKKIATSKIEIHTSRIALNKSRLELELAEANLAAELAVARATLENARADLERFVKIERPFKEEQARRSVRQAEFNIEYTREELKQLKKMYEADDLTEETEEIILTRTRRAVESAEFMLAATKQSSSVTLKVTLPRKLKEMQEAVRKAETAWREAIGTKPADINTKKLELAKSEMDLDTKEKDLRELAEDRKKMILRSPIAGIVYSGAPVAGKWTDAIADDKLQSGSKATVGSTLLTVVDPNRLQVLLAIPEKSLGTFMAAKTCTLTPTGFPDLKLSGTIKDVSLTPTAAGCFQGYISLKATDRPTAKLRPGMTCTVTLSGQKAKK